jgi:hypothetical protein
LARTLTSRISHRSLSSPALITRSIRFSPETGGSICAVFARFLSDRATVTSAGAATPTARASPTKLFLDSLPAFLSAKPSTEAGAAGTPDGPGAVVVLAAWELPLARAVRGVRGENDGTNLIGMLTSSSAGRDGLVDDDEATLAGLCVVRFVELASSERGGMIGFTSESLSFEGVGRSFCLRLLMTCTLSVLAKASS